MSLSDYLSEHWSMLVPLIGMLILLITEIHLERKMIRRLAVTTGLLFIYSVFCYIETYLSNQTEYSVFRSVLSAINYSLIAFILVEIIMIVYREKRFFVLIPAILNAIICFNMRCRPATERQIIFITKLTKNSTKKRKLFMRKPAKTAGEDKMGLVCQWRRFFLTHIITKLKQTLRCWILKL